MAPAASAAMLSTVRTVLFVMRYPGYCRLYDSVIAELVRRGHRVVLGFADMRYPEALATLDGLGERLEVHGTLARPSGDVARLARDFSRIADTLHYLRPQMRAHREFAGRRAPEGVFEFLGGLDSLPPFISHTALKVALGLERALPAGHEIQDVLRRLEPDVMVVTPLVEDVSLQGELVRAAKSLGIPSVGGVASWDNLTSASLVHHVPDKLLVWNGSQRKEAVELHHVPSRRVVVTGAHPFDRWFGRSPQRTRAEFLKNAGLPTDRLLLLYVGLVAKDPRQDAEKALVAAWIEALRRSDDPALRDAAILIRPHPYNREHWATADLEPFRDVVLWPAAKGNTLTEIERAGYFDSLFHSDAVMGINTSAMVEASIVGTPVFTIRLQEFEHLQDGTLHFRYLLPENGGATQVSSSVEDHVEQLSASLAAPGEGAVLTRDFVRSFIRPRGLGEEVTPLVVDCIERSAAEGQDPWRSNTMSTIASRAWLQWRRVARKRRSSKAAVVSGQLRGGAKK